MAKYPAIVVIGSLNMDVVVEADKLPQAGETRFGQNVRFIPGGKGANQAVALARLNAFTVMVGTVGKDAFGEQIVGAMEQTGVRMNRVKRLERVPTGVASILLAEGDNRIIVIAGANASCSPTDIDRCENDIARADLVLVQLEIPLQTAAYAIRTAKRLGKTVVLNPAPAQALPDGLLRDVDYITPNRLELSALTGIEAAGGTLREAMEALRRQGAGNVVTTLGADGCAYLTRDGKMGTLPGHRVDVVDTTGAGDAFNAGLAYALADGKPLTDAIAFATKVSALSVTRFGAQSGMPTLREVLDFRT